mmetsp:Transcript_5119/g.9547  ORF Transcript_5119/g.9547 Transcript_5119/m.9547 type:complete len:231 (+) Transcript_5119:474-1166(+)
MALFVFEGFNNIILKSSQNTVHTRFTQMNCLVHSSKRCTFSHGFFHFPKEKLHFVRLQFFIPIIQCLVNQKVQLFLRTLRGSIEWSSFEVWRFHYKKYNTAPLVAGRSTMGTSSIQERSIKLIHLKRFASPVLGGPRKTSILLNGLNSILAVLDLFSQRRSAATILVPRTCKQIVNSWRNGCTFHIVGDSPRRIRSEVHESKNFHLRDFRSLNLGVIMLGLWSTVTESKK